MASEDEDIDKLKLPAAVKLAKVNKISISGLKDLEEIKWELKKHLLAGCRKRDDVNIFFLAYFRFRTHTHTRRK
jgi:hypothetical protein